jgi:hypothetical protein
VKPASANEAVSILPCRACSVWTVPLSFSVI